MSDCILCKRKAARIPFHIESISLNLYSAEELCFFIANFIPLAAEIITERELQTWLENECTMPGTADIIASLLTGREDTKGDALKVILKNVNYYSEPELLKIYEKMDQFYKKPEIDKKMARADVLVKLKRYRNAIEDYETILQDPQFLKESPEFRAKLLFNLGCASGKIFRLKDARRYFEQALELSPNERIRRASMAAAYLDGGETAFFEEAKRCEAGIGEKNKVLVEIKSLKDPELKEDPASYAVRWIREYHESMGL